MLLEQNQVLIVNSPLFIVVILWLIGHLVHFWWPFSWKGVQNLVFLKIKTINFFKNIFWNLNQETSYTKGDSSVTIFTVFKLLLAVSNCTKYKVWGVFYFICIGHFCNLHYDASKWKDQVCPHTIMYIFNMKQTKDTTNQL
jgi:hypothetical protein